MKRTRQPILNGGATSAHRSTVPRPVARPDSEDLQHLCERGQRLRQLRELRGLTQAQLAEKVGFEQGQISNWEAGRRGMTATTAVVLARALESTTDQLLVTGVVASNGAADPLTSDPYPNRRRLRQLPEFQAAPRDVQEYVVSLRRVHGDRTFFEWIDEFRRLVKLNEDGEWNTLFAGGDLPPPRRPRVC